MSDVDNRQAGAYEQNPLSGKVPEWLLKSADEIPPEPEYGIPFDECPMCEATTGIYTTRALAHPDIKEGYKYSMLFFVFAAFFEIMRHVLRRGAILTAGDVGAVVFSALVVAVVAFIFARTRRTSVRQAACCSSCGYVEVVEKPPSWAQGWKVRELYEQQ